MNSWLIFYVKDQDKSMKFYRSVLAQEPDLHVPGMSEFKLSEQTSLGLMPESGIKKLLNEHLPDPEKTNGAARAELYLSVENPNAYHQRALLQGAVELSPLLKRNWGDEVAYSLDPDGHVLAFAGTPS
jgi:uncharacterized glyoxalase superfamily protein PhnB